MTSEYQVAPSLKLSADAPISKSDADLLGRAGFATSCAQAIFNWQDEASLVIAIWGDWGSGKTSLKNLIVESLRQLDRDQAIVEFNPWQVFDSDQLLQAFFSEVGKAIEHPIGREGKAAAEERSAKWKAYSTVLSLGGSIAKSAAILTAFTGVPVAPALLTAGAEAMERAGKIAKEGAEGLDAEAKRVREKTVSELKGEVADALKSLQRPLLVVLDDLDRLTSAEIRHVIQLVKATADFPHLVYLILARRESVIEALKEIAPGSAEEFLEKIVQVPLHMPRIGRVQIERLLSAGLDRLLEDANFAKHFDQERWVALYRNGMEGFFENLRDVNRYLSSLSFHAGVFRSQQGSYEVNAIDLFGVETLRVFAPTMYEQLPALKAILTDQFRPGRETAKNEDLARLGALLNSVAEADRSAARHILKVLFPPARAILDGSHFYNTDQEMFWVKDLRVASDKQFDRYFEFVTPSGEISEGELQDLLGKLSDKTALAAKFADLESRGLLDQALSRLDYHRHGLSREDPEGVLTVLLSLDVHERDGFFLVPFSPQTLIWRIVYAYLREEPLVSERARIIGAALKASSSLRTSVGIARRVISHSERHPTGADMLLAAGATLDSIKATMLSKIRKASATANFASDRTLVLSLQLWKAWGNPIEAMRCAKRICRSSDGLLKFLKAFQRVSQSQGSSPIIKERRFFALSDLEEFVDLKVLRAGVQKLNLSGLTTDEQEMLTLFQKALDRRDAGEKDYDGLSSAWEEEVCK